MHNEKDTNWGSLAAQCIKNMGKKSNRIATIEDLKFFAKLIGRENMRASKRAIKDGCFVWIFSSEKEIDANTDLSKKEKAQCKRILKEERLGYAGWVRKPSKPVPGFVSFIPAQGNWSH